MKTQKLIKQLTLAAAMVLISSCATPIEKLKPEAASVSILTSVTVTELDKLQKLGAGSCEIGANARTQQSNITSCQNYLRNEAATKNADFIVFNSSVKKGISTGSVEATFYKKRDIANIK